jgi:predicted transport protein
MNMNYVKPERIFLKNHPEFSEKWLQDRISDDPSMLGLGDLILKDRERLHPKAGRLDLLLQDAESNRRYEVEIQLGATDESHVIRTLEYWDIERKRYPQYDHTAVIVAEDITSRFLNVIGLFNGFIPLIALQLNGFRIGDNVSVVFTKVLDEMRLGLVDEDEEVRAVADRAYWEDRAAKSTLAMTDELFANVKTLDPQLELKYNKFYIGLARNGEPSNFVIFKPKREWLRVELRLQKTDEMDARLDEAGLDVMDYDTRWGRYRIRITRNDFKKQEELLRQLLRQAYDNAMG